MSKLVLSSIWRWLVRLSLLVLVLGAAGYFYFGARSSSSSRSLSTAPVTRGDVEMTVLASGTLKPVKLVAVGAQVSGRVTSVKVKPGQQVASGDLVAEIDSITQENSLRTAQATLANVKAQKEEKEASLDLAVRTYTRQKNMIAQRAVSQADFESAEATVATTRAQIDALAAQIIAAEVAVATAQANLGYTKITAPINGTVLSVVTQQGQTVNAVQSAPTIIILGELETMTVRAEISEADIVRVKTGQRIYFTIIGDPDSRYGATLEQIEPAPESIKSDSSFTSSSSSSSSTSSSSSAIYYIGVFNVPNQDHRLRTYMTAEVHIVLGEAKDVLTVASAALGRKDKDGRYAVRVVDRFGEISERFVEVGLNNKVTAEVMSGLEQGERVVIAEASAQTSSSTSSRPPGPPPMGF